MIKYADWINLMSYDLHGVWDATNPIGSIVQGHTNLTEIKLAAELFWRVNIPPAKIVLGFGFYGRYVFANSSLDILFGRAALMNGSNMVTSDLEQHCSPFEALAFWPKICG